jgi:serine/threonine protein phosphatase PrpC
VPSFLNRFLRKKTSPAATYSRPEQAAEGDLKDQYRPASTVKEVLPGAVQSRPHLAVPQFIVGVAQSAGVQRNNNEDSLFTLTTNLLVDEKSVNFGLYIVADGMGGHDNGELASHMAVDILTSHVINTLYLKIVSTTGTKNEVSLHEVMLDGTVNAHQAIKKETEGGGTTLTAALILGDQLTLTHVGDSRAYYFDPQGNMKLLTRDHSLVKRLEEIGQISAEQALTHPQRNVLYRALGQGEPFEPDIASIQIHPGCQLLICSDGLWGVITEEDLAAIVTMAAEPQLICQSLVDVANQAGGPDNISVIIVRLAS